MPDPSAGRVRAAAIVVAAVALAGALNSYRIADILSTQSPDTYGIGLAHRRFAPALTRLPDGGRVAYISDLDVSQLRGSTAFLGAQSALAPRQLVPVKHAAGTPWAVGNFSQPRDYAAAGALHGYRVIEDLGNGVILYRLEGR